MKFHCSYASLVSFRAGASSKKCKASPKRGNQTLQPVFEYYSHKYYHSCAHASVMFVHGYYIDPYLVHCAHAKLISEPIKAEALRGIGNVSESLNALAYMNIIPHDDDLIYYHKGIAHVLSASLGESPHWLVIALSIILTFCC
jgi:hypothetical protein